jgi:hypothetical protein
LYHTRVAGLLILWACQVDRRADPCITSVLLIVASGPQLLLAAHGRQGRADVGDLECLR